MIETKTLKTLEFFEILESVAAYAVSDPSKAAVREIVPENTLTIAARALELTGEAYLVRYKYNYNPIVPFDDCLSYVAKAEIGAVLQPEELLKVAGLIRSARIAKACITGCGEDVSALKQQTAFMGIPAGLEKDIGDTIASEVELKDDASPELKNIRRKIASANARLKERLNGYVRSGAKYMQDTIVTVRDGRFVLPVKSECRSMVPGLVHDMSGSGATVFIEPFPAVELNNELRTLQSQEREEIERILKALSGAVSENAQSLRICQEQCVMLDIIYAKMNYSVAIRGICPKLNEEGYMNLIEARHPSIHKDKVVPVSLSVGKDYQLLIITGPNTGGKTVCLKTVGLMCLMAYSGIYIPCAENSSVAVYDNIYCDIGDEQSIEQSLSTFSSHIVNMVSITDHVTKNSLVLLDELGAGTDPHEGAALAEGIIKYLELVGTKGIVTTHYSELKEYSLVSKNLMNACMQFDENTLRPTYKLMIGIPGVSNALKISQSLGLNDYIVKEAYSCLKTEQVQFELVLENAERVKAEALKELADATRLKNMLTEQKNALDSDRERLQEKLERINNSAKIETKRLVSLAQDEADEIIEEMKQKLRSADEAALLEAKRLRNRLEDMKYANDTIDRPKYEPIDPQEVKPGVQVVVKSLGSVGIVKSQPNKKNEVTVSVGAINMTVGVGDLGKAVIKKAVKTVSAPKTKRTEDGEKGICEIKVLGLTVSEAIDVVEPYIIDISNTNNRILKIVHGKGTGALGRGIQNYLRSNPSVASYRYGRYGEGETGVTIVEIK